MRILLVEDDRLLADGIQQCLSAEGYTVDWLMDGRSAIHALACEEFDAVVLDLGLPKLDGVDALKKLRRDDNGTPVLVLTARDAVEDRVRGLDAGADDYLTKPFDVDELKARLRALLRRQNGRSNNLIEFGEIALDPQSQQVRYQGRGVALSRREYALLRELLEHAGQVLSRDQLEQLLYGWQEEVESNVLEVHIHHLRKKFYPELIRTVRGVGYIVEKHCGS